MMRSSNKLEQIGFGIILCLALVMFFSPLVKLRGPDGDLQGDAYNVRAGIARLHANLDVIAAMNLSQDQTTSARFVKVTPASAEPSSTPLSSSLRFASLAPWLILAALACAALALLDLLSFRRAFTVLSLAGGCLGALAVLQLMLMDSALRSWTADLISSGGLAAPDDPALITRLLMVNSFQIRPGLGLLALTACLFLVPIVSYTRAIPRARSVVRRYPRVRVSQPILVRPLNSHYPEEMCTTFDISQGGVSVESALNHYYVGMEVYLTHNALPGESSNREEHGSVVRVEKLENGKCRFAISIISVV